MPRWNAEAKDDGQVDAKRLVDRLNKQAGIIDRIVRPDNVQYAESLNTDLHPSKGATAARAAVWAIVMKGAHFKLSCDEQRGVAWPGGGAARTFELIGIVANPTSSRANISGEPPSRRRPTSDFFVCTCEEQVA